MKFSQSIHFIHFGTTINTFGGSIITTKLYDCQPIDEYSNCTTLFYDQLQKYLQKHETVKTICYIDYKENTQFNQINLLIKKSKAFYSQFTFISIEKLIKEIITHELHITIPLPIEYYFTVLSLLYSPSYCDYHLENQNKVKVSSECHYHINRKSIDIFQFILSQGNIQLMNNHLLDGFLFVNIFPRIILFDTAIITKNDQTQEQLELCAFHLSFNRKESSYDLIKKKSLLIPFENHSIDTFEIELLLQSDIQPIIFVCTPSNLPIANDFHLFEFESFEQPIIITDFTILLKEFQRIQLVSSSLTELSNKIKQLQEENEKEHWYCDIHYFNPLPTCSFHTVSTYFQTLKNLLNENL